jgi:hypothetical protein
MAYRATDYLPGSVPMACSICGRRRKFPDEIEKSDDGRFRCLDACSERTVLSVDKERAAFRPQPEQPPPLFGSPVPARTFLQDSQALQQLRIPGWTPTTTFYDDFTIVPGGVGSSWSVATTGTGTVTAPSSGVARFTAGTGSAQSWAPSVSVPQATSGRFYCRARFAFPFTAEGAVSGLASFGATGVAGTPSGFATRLGIRSVVSTSRYVLISLASAVSAMYIDANEHIAELWWTGNGRAYACVDSSEPSFLIVPNAFSSTPAAPSIAAAIGSVMDITDFVCMV